METLAVVRGVAVVNDGLDVLLGRVAHVAFPSVLRVLEGEFSHVFVTIGLCQDRSSRD